jgi:C4-type Zn-finger protein
MKTIDKNGHIREIIPDSKDNFKGICPICGEKLSHKRIKKGGFHRRALKSNACASCGYSEYDSNPREQAITDGVFDDEL